MRHWLASVALVSAIGGSPQQPTASVAGMVVSAESPAQPIRRAVVMLTGSALANNLSAVTDDQGRFAMSGLAPGQYTVTVSKPAYLTIAHGARQPGRPGTPIAISAGQRVSDLRLALPRGAVLSGVVRDLSGAPLMNTPVTIALAESAAAISSWVSPSEGILTDDRGVYRAYGLAPGEYLIAATPRVSGQADLTRRSPTDNDTALRLLQQRGTAALAAPGPGAAVPRVGSAPIFYPGTPMPHDAARVRLAAGEVREGLDFSVDVVPAVEIAGAVRSGDGSPLSGLSLELSPIGPPLPVFSSLAMGSRQGADGSFTYSGVTPGRYVLVVRSAAAGGRGAPGAGSTAQRWAITELLVNGANIENVTLILRPAMSLAGRVAFDATTVKPPADLTTVRVGLTRPGPGTATMLNGVTVAGLPSPTAPRVQPDGTFAVTGILPGVFTLVAAIPGTDGWWLRSATAAGRDLLDSPLEFGTATTDIADAVLTFSDRHSELSGTLQSAAGQPASDYVVVVFSADRAHWYPGARRTRLVRPASDGQFAVADLPAGDYLVAALTDVDPNDAQQPSFLEQLLSASIKIRVVDGAKVRQDLRIGR